MTGAELARRTENVPEAEAAQFWNELLQKQSLVLSRYMQLSVGVCGYMWRGYMCLCKRADMCKRVTITNWDKNEHLEIHNRS